MTLGDQGSSLPATNLSKGRAEKVKKCFFFSLLTASPFQGSYRLFNFGPSPLPASAATLAVTAVAHFVQTQEELLSNPEVAQNTRNDYTTRTLRQENFQKSICCFFRVSR